MNLRSRLKEATAADHSNTEAVFDRFDLSTPDGRAGFVAAQLAAVAACARHPVAADGPGDRDAADRALVDAHAAWGGAADAMARPDPDRRPIDARALRYVLTGARLGQRVLARRWLAAGGPDDHPFLARPADPGAWRRLLDELVAAPANDAAADRTVADARRTFALFAAAADAALPVPIAAGCPHE